MIHGLIFRDKEKLYHAINVGWLLWPLRTLIAANIPKKTQNISSRSAPGRSRSHNLV